MASAVLDEIITDGMTPYEKDLAVYDWMCANLGHEGGVTVVIPTAPEYSAEPYGVLKYGAAVCVGFATTFRLFMQMMDIDCMVVHNSYHSWNLVNLDGEWYHTDIYSDVDRGNYANFNMTDEMCSRAMTGTPAFSLPPTGLHTAMPTAMRRSSAMSTLCPPWCARCSTPTRSAPLLPD